MNKQFLHHNASTVLTCLGGVGVVTTAIFAAKATPKAIELIKESELEKGDELTNYEKVKVAGKVYIPTIISGVATIGCVIGANVLNKHQQASLVSAYALAESSYKQYRQKNIELYGEDIHNDIMDAIAAEEAETKYIRGSHFVDETDLQADILGGEEMLFYDEYGRRFFTSTLPRVMNAEYHLNRNYVLRGFTVLNEFYDFLGLELTDFGSTVGWEPEDESMHWIEFDHRITNIKGEECIVISMPLEPAPGYEGLVY